MGGTLTAPHPPAGQPRQPGPPHPGQPQAGKPQGAQPQHPHPAERDVAAARRAAKRAQLLAAAALVVALLSIIVSAMTAISGGDEGSALPATDSRPTTTSAAEQPDPSDQQPDSNGEPTVIDTRRITPDDDFELVKEKQEFKLYPAEECDLRFFDVDEPRAGAEREVAEFGYGSDCATIKPHIDITGDSAISLVDSPNATAKDCAEAVQRAPVNEPFVPTGDTNLCLITSAEAAAQEGTTRKVALVAVVSLGQDGLMTIEVTTWTVPR